jgi:hypothetical protein
MCSIQNCLPQWHAIGTSQAIIEWIENGVQLPFSVLPPQTQLPNRPLGHDQVNFITKEINELLTEGFIERCTPGYVPHFISPIQAVPKARTGSDKKWRLIIDLRILNSYLSPPTFTNESIKIIQDVVEENDLLVTVDLKNGFYHVVIIKNILGLCGTVKFINGIVYHLAATQVHIFSQKFYALF